MAITKARKEEIVSQYGEWLRGSKAIVLTDYLGLSTQELDALRAKVREAGGEFHIVKNTLGKIAFQTVGLPLPDGFFEGGTAIGFALDDPPGLAKALTEFARTSDRLRIKGGYLGGEILTAEQVTSLADLPPLPVMRARLLGVLLAPASQLVRVLAEPGRQVARVIQAYVDQQGPQPAGS